MKKLWQFRAYSHNGVEPTPIDGLIISNLDIEANQQVPYIVLILRQQGLQSIEIQTKSTITKKEWAAYRASGHVYRINKVERKKKYGFALFMIIAILGLIALHLIL